MSDNFPGNPTDSSLPDIGTTDPNNSSFLGATNNGPFNGKETPNFGKSKIKQTADSAPYNGTSGYGYMSESLASVEQAPGNGSGALTDNNGQGNSSGIPAAQPIDPITFGDPNDTGLDFRDGMDINTVTVKGGGTGGIKGYDLRKPNPMGS